MSNVSQIYGTLRDSGSYIILDSTETEVSGNLSVLQNLDVCGNITFNNTDLSTTLSNLVVDLTGGQDASFTNVDITGILDVGTNGTIKAANFNVGSINVIDGSAGVSCRSLEVKNQSNYICLMAQDSQVNISGNLILNNVDVSGKLTQIDASLVGLASGGGGGGSTTFDNITNSGTYGSKIYLNSGSTNGVHGTWKSEYCHIQGQKSNPHTTAIGFHHDEVAGLNGAGTSMMPFYINWLGPSVVISGQSNGSDDRIKHNEETIKNGLEIIRQLVPEKYIKGKSINDANAFPEAGFIAQKVLDIPDIKFAVTQTNKEFIEGDPSSCLYALDYNSIFTYSVAAIKELDNIVKELSNNLLVANQEILSLKEENILIKQKLNTLLTLDQQI